MLLVQASVTHAGAPLDRVDPVLSEQRARGETPADTNSVAPTLVANDDHPAEPRTSSVIAGAIRVSGARRIPPGHFAKVIDRYVGQSLDTKALKALARDVADIARGEGYIFATAWIPPQDVGLGIVRVELDEGQIDRVVIEGADNAKARHILARLANGDAANKRDTERALQLVGDIPGLQVRSTGFARVGARGVLTVKLVEDKYAARVSIDNRGTRIIGPARIRLEADVRGILMAGDELAVQGIAAPLNGELGLIGATYATAIGSNGTTLSIGGSIGRSRPGSNLRVFGIQGKSSDLSIGVSQPVVRSRKASLWTYAEISHHESEQAIPSRPLREDKVTALTVGLRGYTPALGGRLSGGVWTTQGLGIWGATRERDPLASRSDGDARFTKAVAWFDWNRALDKTFGVRLAGTGQIASRPLLANDEFGLGGGQYGRGYDYYERSGDEGVAGSVEVRANLPRHLPTWLRWSQFYAFADGGLVHNLRSTASDETLTSAGLGIRAGLFRKLDISFETAFPLNAKRFDSNDRSPRLSASLSLGL
jgi:hemolysin activation/secretion protein